MFGCDFRYNFTSIPSKCICYRYEEKHIIDYSSVNLIAEGPKFIKVDEFDKRLGTATEIKNRWSKL